MVAPGGVFDAPDNGAYVVRSAAGAVTATTGGATGRRARKVAPFVGARVMTSLPQDVDAFQVVAKTRVKRAEFLA